MRRALLAWYDRHHRDLPWRRTGDPYRVLVSEVMLQQTQVAAVVPYYERFIAAFPTADALAGATVDEVLALWSGLGYYSRARNLHAACRIVVHELGGRFPDTRDALRRLPGVGEYIAGAVASIAFGEPVPAVDGNVLRVVARLICIPGDVRRGEGRREAALHASALAAGSRPGDWNQAVMELGATLCTPRRPRCGECPIERHCAARAAGLADQIPAQQARPVTERLLCAAGIIVRAGRVLVAKRPDRGLWAGLWEFPNVQAPPGAEPAEVLAEHVRESLGLVIRPAEEVLRLRHGVMQRRIELVAYRCAEPKGRVRLAWHTEARWAAQGELEGLAMPSPHRRIARCV